MIKIDNVSLNINIKVCLFLKLPTVSDEEHSLVFVPGECVKSFSPLLFYLHVISLTLFSRSQTISGVDREVKRQTPFSSAFKTGTKMRDKRGSDSKAEAPLRKGGKKQGLFQSDPSVVYAKERGSFHPAATVAMEHSPSPSSDTFGPSSQVRQQQRSPCSVDVIGNGHKAHGQGEYTSESMEGWIV